MTDIRKRFWNDGCCVVKQFGDEKLVNSMKDRIFDIVKEWSQDENENEDHVFRTDEKQVQAQGNDDYFITSACEIRFFWEDDSDKKKSKTNPKETLYKLNKIGHGLHEKDPLFRSYAHSEKVGSLVRELGWKSPVLPQSMYILKNPKIGGQVTAHQDSSFLYTTPKPSCLGLWLALDDATLENGCLWFRPGSHKEPVRRHFQRVVDPETGNVRMDFHNLVQDYKKQSPLEGIALDESDEKSLIERLKQLGFVSVPVKAGDLVLIHGQVEHLSLANRSSKQRHTFQLHLVEGPDQGITWHKNNWLQYPQGKQFSKL